jgi:hypothetical protein
MFSKASGIAISGGTFSISQPNRTSRGKAPTSFDEFHFSVCSLTVNMSMDGSSYGMGRN